MSRRSSKRIGNPWVATDLGAHIMVHNVCFSRKGRHGHPMVKYNFQRCKISKDAVHGTDLQGGNAPMEFASVGARYARR